MYIAAPSSLERVTALQTSREYLFIAAHIRFAESELCASGKLSDEESP